MDTLMVFMALLLIAMFAEPLAERLGVPFTGLLVVFGFIGSELIVLAGFDTGLRWQNFNTLVLHVLVPILVFESAFNMNARALIKNGVAILFLAVPGMLFAATITAVILFFGIGYPVAFPFLAALLTGVILSATDPVSVVSLFKKLGAPERLTALLEGESLFNDATAIVVYTLLVSAVATGNQEITISSAFIEFGYSFIGGIIVGGLCGLVASMLYRYFPSSIQHTVIGILTATATFYLAETSLHVSGVVAILCAAMILGEKDRSSEECSSNFTSEFWQLAAYICNAIIFILAGATITLIMFESQWLAMLIGIFGAIISRSIVIYLCLPAVLMIPRLTPTPENCKPVLLWGGLRGAVSLALVLALPTTIDSWFTIQSIVYGVVIFTLIVQAPMMPRLVRRVTKESI